MRVEYSNPLIDGLKSTWHLSHIDVATELFGTYSEGLFEEHLIRSDFELVMSARENSKQIHREFISGFTGPGNRAP